MIKLDNSGLDLYLGEDLKLRSFDKEVIISEPSARKVFELKDVLLDEINEDKEIYFMYRGIYRVSDKELFEKNNIRYDVTIIPPNKLGREFVKTLGHRHSCSEIYEVLNGKAVYLMQNENEAISTEVNSWGFIHILNGYDHITINPGSNILVMSNLIKSGVLSDYETLKSKKGMSFFLVEENSEKKFIPNVNYSNINLNVNMQSNFICIPLYNAFLFNPEYFTKL